MKNKIEDKYLLVPERHVRLVLARLPIDHVLMIHFLPKTFAIGIEYFTYGLAVYFGCFAFAIGNYGKFIKLKK